MSSLLKGILSKNNFPLEAHKASHNNNTQTQENTLNFFCRNHSKKPIVFICTAKDCENNLLCAACVLDSPSLLIKYKDHIYTLQDYFEGSKNKILQVKIDKEFQSLRKRVTDVLEVSKDDIKRSFSGGSGAAENPNFAHIEKKLVEASFLNNNKDDTLDKENLQKFIKDASKYEELERKSYENGGCKGASALETRYFEFLVKIKSQVDSFCRNVQKQTSSFVDIVKELENVSEQRDTIETRRTVTTNPNEVSMSVDATNKRRLETSYNNVSHNRSVMVTQGEESFLLNTEARESVREHNGGAKHHQLKTILTTLSKNTSDNTTNPSSNSVSPSYLPTKPVPRAGLKLVKEFPTSNNPSIKDALAKHGPFRHENYSAVNNNNNNESSFAKRQRYGPIALENGDVYEGEWVEDRREGYGKLISVAGFFFDGFWKDNVAHGRGRLININGDMYEGDWENGKYHGRGTFIGVNGYQYTGDWYQDMQHGSGSEYWPDGSCYEGEYKMSKKHGKGVFKWANGEKYTGEFSLNNMNGNGVYEWPNGQKYYGYWAENKIMGEGRLEEPKAAGQKIGEWDKKVLLSPDCALYKRELKSKGGEDLTVDPRYRDKY